MRTSFFSALTVNEANWAGAARLALIFPNTPKKDGEMEKDEEMYLWEELEREMRARRDRDGVDDEEEMDEEKRREDEEQATEVAIGKFLLWEENHQVSFGDNEVISFHFLNKLTVCC